MLKETYSFIAHACKCILYRCGFYEIHRTMNDVETQKHPIPSTHNAPHLLHGDGGNVCTRDALEINRVTEVMKMPLFMSTCPPNSFKFRADLFRRRFCHGNWDLTIASNPIRCRLRLQSEGWRLWTSILFCSGLPHALHAVTFLPVHPFMLSHQTLR